MSYNGAIESQISSLQTHEDRQEETNRPSCRFKIFIIVLWGGEVTIEIRVFESEASVKRVEWLKDMVKAKLLEAVKAKKREFDISRNMAFRTRKRYVTHDYLLSMESSPLSLFPNLLELIPVFLYEPQNFIAPSPEYSVNIHDFDVVCKLGEGGFSRVFLVRKRDSGEMFAMKVLKKGVYRKPQLEKTAVQNERNLLIKLRSQMAIKLYYAFQTDEGYFLVMTYMPGGNLRFILREVGTFNENTARHIAAEVLLNLKVLHDASIIYRDLKTENLIFDVDGHLHICDFGTAKQLPSAQTLLYIVCGTQETMAPEVITGEGYSLTADYYSLGALIHELLVGHPPIYRKHSGDKIYNRILTEKIQIPKQFSPELQNLLQSLLEKHPSKRLGAKSGIQEIMEHKWFQKIDFEAIRNKKSPVDVLRYVSELHYDVETAGFMGEKPQIIGAQMNNAMTSSAHLKNPFGYNYQLDDEEDEEVSSRFSHGMTVGSIGMRMSETTQEQRGTHRFSTHFATHFINTSCTLLGKKPPQSSNRSRRFDKNTLFAYSAKNSTKTFKVEDIILPKTSEDSSAIPDESHPITSMAKLYNIAPKFK